MDDIEEQVRRVFDSVKPVTVDEARHVSARRRVRCRLAAGAATAVVAVAAVIVAVTFTTTGGDSAKVSVVGGPPAGSTQTIPLADTALTPAGWSPIGSGALQVSVPSGWTIEGPSSHPCDPGLQGAVYVDGVDSFSPPAGIDCAVPQNLVLIFPTAVTTLQQPVSTSFNGIPATTGNVNEGATEVVQTLGMQIDVTGPLGGQVLRTLTHSPLSAVLDGPAAAVPADWRAVTFGGLRFAVPPGWTETNSTQWYGCDSNLSPQTLELSTAQNPTAPSCPAAPQTAGYLAGQPAMIVDVGPLVTAAPPTATCSTSITLRICIDAPDTGVGSPRGDEGNVLTAQITIPDQPDTAQIKIGLAGSGLQAKQIFDSLTPANPTAGTATGATTTAAAPSTTNPPQQLVTVPNLIGQTQAEAVSELTRAKLNARAEPQTSNTLPAGDVLGEIPAAGTALGQGSTVNLYVSSGPPGLNP